MAHKVIFNLPRRELGREDIEFIVEQDGKRFGTLLVSKGAVEWRPTNKVYRRKLNWTRFDQAMRSLRASNDARAKGELEKLPKATITQW